MKKILKIELILILSILLIIFLSLFIQYNWSKDTVEKETKHIMDLKINLLEDDLHKWISKNIGTIEETAKYIENVEFDETRILNFLMLKMGENKAFYSIYYLSTENKMINGSGWTPPEGLDLRDRPWYLSAISKRGTSMTEAFINASKDDIVITIASPVEKEGEIIGVVGGDISLQNIINKVKVSNISPKGFTLIINNQEQIIAHSAITFDKRELSFIQIPEELKDELEGIVENSYDDNLISIDKKDYKGYLSYLPIEDSNWFLVGYIPVEEYMVSINQITFIFIIVSLIFLGTFSVFLLLQNKYMFRPIIELSDAISGIDIKKNEFRRIPLKENDFLYELKWTLNGLFEKVETYFKEINFKKMEKDEAYKKLKRNFDVFIKSYSKIVDMKDPYTSGHQNEVAYLAEEIGKRLNLSSEELEGLKIAAVLHDIGKLRIPTEILNKASGLSELEYEMIKEHPVKSCELLSDIDFDQPVKEIILQHHEKINGTGYPHGLTGEEILLQARILCVADVVKAMSSHRPYRPAFKIEEVLKYIKENAGTLFDERVVKACLDIFNEGFEFNREDSEKKNGTI